MTHKPLIWTDHVLDQMDERGFTRNEVKWLIARGRRYDDPEPGYEPRKIAEAYIRGREAGVCFAENAERIRVVSVWWVVR